MLKIAVFYVGLQLYLNKPITVFLFIFCLQGKKYKTLQIMIIHHVLLNLIHFKKKLWSSFFIMYIRYKKINFFSNV